MAYPAARAGGGGAGYLSRPGGPLPTVLVVSNPRSRRNRRDPALAERLGALVAPVGRVASPAGADALRDTVARALDEGVEVLALNGGDGTGHVVLTEWVAQAGEARPLPLVQLLCGGTMNTIASGLGVHGAPEGLLGALVAALREGRAPSTAERSLLRVGGQRPQYGFLFGNGLISNFLEVYYEGAEPSPAKGAWVLARAVGSALVDGPLSRRIMRPVRCEVEVDGARWPRPEWLAITAGTVDDIGLRFRPFPEAPRRPGHVQVLGLGCSPMGVVGELGRIRLAEPTRHPDIASAVTRRFVLRGEGPLPFMVDGDFYPGDPVVEVRTGPTVRFVVG